MFTTGCQDAAVTVSVAAMSATAAYINALSDDPDVMQLQCVITPMLGVMAACLQRGNAYYALFIIIIVMLFVNVRVILDIFLSVFLCHMYCIYLQTVLDSDCFVYFAFTTIMNSIHTIIHLIIGI